MKLFSFTLILAYWSNQLLAQCTCNPSDVSWQTGSEPGGPSVTLSGLSEGQGVRVWPQDQMGNHAEMFASNGGRSATVRDYTVSSRLIVEKICGFNVSVSCGTFNTTSPMPFRECDCPRFEWLGKTESNNGYRYTVRVFEPGQYTLTVKGINSGRGSGQTITVNRGPMDIYLFESDPAIIKDEKQEVWLESDRCIVPSGSSQTIRWRMPKCKVTTIFTVPEVDLTNLPNSTKKESDLKAKSKTLTKPNANIPNEESSNISIMHDVPFMGQPTISSCWATSMAMIMLYCINQREGISPINLAKARTEDERVNTICRIAEIDGEESPCTGHGLLADSSFPIGRFHFHRIQDQTLANNEESVRSFARQLESGPILVGYNSCHPCKRASGHMSVVIGMEGDGNPETTFVILHDPDDGGGRYPNNGLPFSRKKYSWFVGAVGGDALGNVPYGSMFQKNCQ